jgi:UDP-glucose 4-epimerase
MKPLNVLVTGGAGYIGSHTHWRLVEAGYKVTVVDNLYSGHRWAVHPQAEFVLGNAGDISLVRSIIRDRDIKAVVHFAGHIVVPESIEDPLKYYENNTCVSQRLITACIAEKVSQFVFSSTAAVYGEPRIVPVSEDLLPAPVNPYGASKLMTEWMLRDVGQSLPAFRYICLRYFNAAGARPDGLLGQATPRATHLIKVACEAAVGTRDHISIFGTDYQTPDGTCIRDYVHVEDLAEAHLDALRYLDGGGASGYFNCGYGKGYSVRQVLETVRRVSGRQLNVREAARRPGDPETLVADGERIRRVIGWKPRCDSLDDICRSAYQWELSMVGRKHGE